MQRDGAVGGLHTQAPAHTTLSKVCTQTGSGGRGQLEEGRQSQGIQGKALLREGEFGTSEGGREGTRDHKAQNSKHSLEELA